MHVAHLRVANFRSYAAAEIDLEPGVTTLVGLNGRGKTNLVEAIGYVATLGSHRVAKDAPLVKYGTEAAGIGAGVVHDGHRTDVDLQLIPGSANKARLGRAAWGRPRDILGTLRTVLFAPEDLALIKGDPSDRRRFLDDLLVARQPRWAGVRADLDKILRQRGALLRSAAPLLKGEKRGRRRHPDDPAIADELSAALHTLDIWNEQVATVGAQLLYARLRLLRDLRPYLAEAYAAVSASTNAANATYRASLREPMADRLAAGDVPEIPELREEILATLAELRDKEIERSVTLAGPHRDELELTLGDLPAKGYASHGESWSFALALRLASFRLLRHDLHTDPVLILDDVFAELDAGRRERLAELVADCEQVLITAAVPADIPAALWDAGKIFEVTPGVVRPLTEQEVADARPA